MEGLRQYVVMLTAVSLICGILISFLGEKGPAAGLGKLVIGIVLVIAAVSPLTGIRIQSWNFWLDDLRQEGESVAAEGAEKALDARIRLIKAGAAEYIHDTARDLGAEVEAVVEVSADDLPRLNAVTLRGKAGAYTRQRLEERIAADLGIAKENMEWIGLPSGS